MECSLCETITTTGRCQVVVVCNHEELRNDLTNEPSCQMGHLSSYLLMWHA